MLRCMRLAVGLLIGVNGLAGHAGAQFMFPPGYGGFGMSQWGANPAAGYMAGLGSFGAARGPIWSNKAEADSINVETMTRWNKALRARQAAVREDQAREAARRQAARQERVDRANLRDGTALNSLLVEIFDIDPTAAKTGRAKRHSP